MAPQKRRIAVLGGGIGGLSTAYEILCKHPEYEITIFELSWRLGGKCAAPKNAAIAGRNEEHGIHVLFGCYENGFHLVRRVYDELGINWRSAFEGQSSFTVFDKGGGQWEPWNLRLPTRSGDPGDWFESRSDFPSLLALARRLLRWVWKNILDYGSSVLPLGQLDALQPLVDTILARLEGDPTTVQVEAALGDLERAFELFDRLARVEGRVVSALRRHENGLAVPSPLRKLRVLAEIGLAACAGLLRAVIAGKGLYELNDKDLIEWLNESALGGGLSDMAANCGPLRMIYEASFAFEEGDTKRPNYAAGTALYVMFRMLLDYRGDCAYTMKAGTAETLITPLYRVLQRRRVRFEFFHRVDEITLTADQRNIAAIKFCVQSKPKSGDYDPLIDGSNSWPDRPKYSLLKNGDVLQQSDELEPAGYDLEDPRTKAPPLGKHEIVWRGAGGTGENCFDEVILAIPPAASRLACKALEQSHTAGDGWRRMFNGIKDTPTQACQIWFDRTAGELGSESKGGSALVGSYEQPFSNWADYSCVLPSEHWPVDVRSVAYLCGCLVETPDLKTFDPKHWRQTVRQSAEEWLETHAKILWPKLFVGRRLDWDRLVDLDGKSGKERLAAQFFRANLSLSGRYVLSVKGSFAHRKAAWESGFDNLFLAGDWTRNGADNGCVEATVMSARRAARAILGLAKDELPVYGEGA